MRFSVHRSLLLEDSRTTARRSGFSAREHVDAVGHAVEGAVSDRVNALLQAVLAPASPVESGSLPSRRQESALPFPAALRVLGRVAPPHRRTPFWDSSR